MDFSVFSIFVVISENVFIHGAPTYDSKELDVDVYLRQYGFASSEDRFSQARSANIKLYQQYYQLEQTGIVDDATFTLMTTSRCGVPDNPEILRPYEDHNISDSVPIPYKLSGPKWKNRKVRWVISRHTKQIEQESQRKSFSEAFKRWEEVSGLTFEYSKANVDIDIRFVSRDHGDGSAFDGRSNSNRGNVLAHAFPPGTGLLSGDAHFDNDEIWTVDANNDKYEKKYLEKVAAHEFGHSLGLQHSAVEGALMSAYYSSKKMSYELSFDDVNAIQALYGKPDGWFPTLWGSVPTRLPLFPSCTSLFQAIVWGPDRRAYGVLMDNVYEINLGRSTLHSVHSLQYVFTGAPVQLDFAFTMNKTLRSGQSTTLTYMFMGNNFWRFTGYTLDPGFPKPFHIGNLPEPPITAVVITELQIQSVLMIGTSKWWLWDEESQLAQDEVIGNDYQGYWSHAPPRFPLVTSWLDGDVYLIDTDNYVRLNGRNAKSGYPMKGVPDWISESCPHSASVFVQSSSSTTMLMLLVLFAVI